MKPQWIVLAVNVALIAMLVAALAGAPGEGWRSPELLLAVAHLGAQCVLVALKHLAGCLGSGD